MTKPKQKQVFTSRRMSRIQTLQLLFESDLRDSYNQEDDNNISTEFTNLLITGIKKNIIDIDKNIKKYAPDWPINQMPIIDKNILRVAIYEIIYKDAIPKVIANESVELAKLFGSESSPKFINGVLGSLIESKEKITI
ncbi:MAG: transcription antitermination factor NusB [Chloroflexi bacterium]|jgi:N utilization substance protein B|nr:transcription antitermination factor NusB [Chloroflexota bacterium]MCH2305225.1 transcription antitermination factor NusB [SAR202 cluster bacterium]|tara:strand:- start:708 stop:1121 length:414 start_codon:yes stop_codon:yes gene_type:complete